MSALMNGRRARMALSYWRASLRLLRADRRVGFSPAAANLTLINHTLESGWPRLSVAAAGALVLLRRRATAHAPTCGGRSRSRGRRPRCPRD